MARTALFTLAVAAAACAVASAPLSAAWQVVDTNAGVQTEVDPGSAVRKDGTVTGWVQHTYSKKTTTQTGAYFVYRTMKEQVRMNCGQQTATVLMRGYFDDDGSEIASIKGNGETRTVMPETGEQRVLSRLCNPVTEARAPRARAAAPAAADSPPADPRYMDGPPPTALKSGIVRAKADAHDVPAPAAPTLVKPADKAAPAAVEKPDAKASEKAAPKAADAAPAKPEAAAAAAAKAPAPAAVAHGAAPHGAAAAKPAPPVAARDHETRAMTAARVMKARVGAPMPAEHAPRVRTAHATTGAAGSALTHQAHDAHWDYEGENAPFRWGDMKTEFSTCKTGARQSPIDIRNPVISEVEPIQFHYEDVALKVSNNGHTIQVDYAPGSFILYAGARYELVQFHFHSPSEERINGRAFDMVAHLVHRSAQGRLAVVAVLLAAGREQPMLQAVWAAMPGTRDRTRERLDVAINVKQLLPADPTYYSYMGSLTTPPCTEGVQWLVMKTPIEMSREQIAHFTALYPMNARPLQASNDRVIKTGK